MALMVLLSCSLAGVCVGVRFLKGEMGLKVVGNKNERPRRRPCVERIAGSKG